MVEVRNKKWYIFKEGLISSLVYLEEFGFFEKGYLFVLFYVFCYYMFVKGYNNEIVKIKWLFY